MNIEKLIRKIKLFDPKFFFEYLSIISIHPANQKYLTRFELLMSAFFSIKENDFQRTKNNRNEIVLFFKEIENDFDNIFFQIEDYIPFDQNKLIPLFIDGNKYYFFYGLIENPYTRIKILSDIIYDIEESVSIEVKEYQNLFQKSLKIQTSVLEKIVNDDEDKLSNNCVFIPSLSYFEKFKFQIRIEDEEILNSCFLGCLQHNQKELLDKCFNFQTPYLFPFPFAKIDNQKYILLPHFHIEYFGNKIKNIVNKSSNYGQIWDEIDLNFKNRLDLLCSKFFSINPQVFVIYANKESNENLLDKYNVACCFLIDSNKLLFFKSLNHKENKNYSRTSETFQIAQKSLLELNQEILNNIEIGIGQFSTEYIFGLNTNELEIWNILVSENISLEMDSVFMDKNRQNEHFVEIGDLAFVFDKFLEYRNKAPHHFLKFLQNDRDLLNSPNSLLTTGYLDRVSIYLNSDNYYFKFGKSPDLLNIASYQGNEFESEYYYEKFKDGIYDVVESKFPNEFNVFEHIENNSYRLVNIADMYLLYIVNITNYPIYIFPPMKISILPNEDGELLSILLPQLFGFYIDKLSKEFIDLLKNLKIFPSEYSLLITSNNALKQKENRLTYLLPLTDKISNQPFYIETKQLQNGSVRSFIIANTEKIDVIIKLFKPENNSAERHCFKELLISIFNLKKIKKANQKATDFIDEYITKSKKSFSFNLFHTENPKLDKYSSSIKINPSDISKVNKLFAEYLVKIKINPGIYSGAKSKEINGVIFDYLQKLLEKNISEFNANIILFSYQQLEFTEGMRAMNNIKYGMNTNRVIRYDLKENAKNETRPLILQSAYTKHILQTILKVNPRGKKHITETDWTFLLGIVAALMETSQIYEYINYDLSPHNLIISDLYEVSTEKISDKIDHEKWQNELVEHQIENSKYLYKKASETPIGKEELEEIIIDEELDNDSLIMDQINKLDSIHIDEYNYSIRNQIDIIYALYRSNFDSQHSFPLSIVTREEIAVFVNNVIPEIEKEEIIIIIDKIALSYKTYKKEDRLIPSELLRSRKRINVCPIINIGENQYLFGNQLCKFSHQLWWNEILGGDFPYKVNNKKISDELDKIHKINSNQLEIDTAKYLKKKLGKKLVLLNLKKFNNISSNLPKSPPCGEIDVLCANPDNKTIYVLEAKSILQKNRPYNINQIFKDFFGTSGKRYLIKLNKKHQFVKENLELFLTYFKLNYDNEWKVERAFVVDKNILAAYHTEFKLDFVQISELENYINKRTMPNN